MKKKLSKILFATVIVSACVACTNTVCAETLYDYLTNTSTEPFNAESNQTILAPVGNVKYSKEINMNGYSIDGNGNSGIVIYSDNKSLTINDATKVENFVGASGAHGGFIKNDKKSTITINNSNFSNIHTTGSGDGGVIYTKGTMNITDSTFDNNNGNSGGAIYVKKEGSNTTTLTDTSFTNNVANNNGSTAGGGAIYNKGIVKLLQGVFFKDNSTGGVGGAIYSDNNLEIDPGSQAVFENNQAGRNGGAIYAKGTTVIKNTRFEGNKSNLTTTGSTSGGGAIFNQGTLSISDDSVFYNNETQSNGGAIYSEKTFSISDTEFNSNTAAEKGGAIYAKGSTSGISILNTDFIGNKANGTSSSPGGGAIYFQDKATDAVIDKSIFDSNEAENGGALYINNTGTTLTITDTDFTDNTAATKGGAIFNKGILTIESATQDVLFEGNTANGDSNAIHNEGSVVFNAGLDTNIILKDGITSSTSKVITKTGAGALLLDADMQGYTGTVDLNEGSIKIGSNGTYFNHANKVNVNGGILDAVNNQIDTIDLGTTVLNSDLTAKLDLDLPNCQIDTFTSTSSLSGSGKIIISDINMTLKNDSDYSTLIAKVADDAVKDYIELSNDPNIKYDFGGQSESTWYITYDSGDGYLTFTQFGDLRTVILDTTRSQKVYNMGIDEAMSDHVGAMGGDSLVVKGNGHIIDGDSKTGIIVANSNQELTFRNATVKNYSGATDTNGGFINNEAGGTLTFDTVTFENNQTTGTTEGKGGVLYNSGNATITNSTFDANSAVEGGAIYNEAGATISMSGVTVNAQTGSAQNDVYNKGTINTSGINKFISKLTNKGIINLGGTNDVYEVEGDGTINNVGTLNIKGDGSAYTGSYIQTAGVTNYEDASAKMFGGTLGFQGGTLNVLKDLTLSGDAYSYDAAVINIPAAVTLELKDITSSGFVLNGNDNWLGTVSVKDNGILIVNDLARTTGILNQTSGEVNFNNSTLTNTNDSITGGTFVLNNSILNYDSNASFTPSIFTMTNNSIVNMIDNNIGPLNLNDVNISGNNNIAIDINPNSLKSDTVIISGDLNGNGTLKVADFNIIDNHMVDRNYEFQVVDVNGTTSDNIEFLSTNKQFGTPIGKYNLFSEGRGKYNLKLTSFNPQVYRGQVATLAAYNNQLNITNMLADHFILQNSQNVRQASLANKYAATGNALPYQTTTAKGGLWFKPYVDIETLSMTRGLKVNNNAYGALIGADFPTISLKRGWEFIPTAYIAYNGGAQSFRNVHMYQNGGQGGFMGTFIKNDFIGSIMAYGGGYSNEMHVAGHTDNTGNWFVGTAAKAAYDFHPAKHFIIQPTAFVSYNLFGKQNWHSDFGALSMNSGLLNGVNVAPGLNLIYARDTWSLYATIQYMYNINDQIGGKAGNIGLPTVKMRHGYIQYGVGATKVWNDIFNSYFQVYIRNAGRTGVGFQLGVKYFFDSIIPAKMKNKKSQIQTTPETSEPFIIR